MDFCRTRLEANSLWQFSPSALDADVSSIEVEDVDRMNVAIRSGTLIIGIQTDNGFVVVADKESADVTQSVIAGGCLSVSKIGVLGARKPYRRSTVFGLTGVASARNLTFGESFDATAIIEKYFKFEDPRLVKKHLPILSRALGRSLSKTLRGANLDQVSQAGLVGAETFVRALFFYRRGPTSIGAASIELSIGAGEEVSCNALFPPDDILQTKPIFSWGRTSVVTELLSGCDPAFDDLRARALITTYLGTRPNPGEMTSDLAVALGRDLIAASSIGIGRLESLPVGISTECDVAVMRHGTEVEWIPWEQGQTP